MTLMEYLQDYASPETKKVGLELIQKELENIPSEKVKRLTEEHTGRYRKMGSVISDSDRNHLRNSYPV